MFCLAAVEFSDEFHYKLCSVHVAYQHSDILVNIWKCKQMYSPFEIHFANVAKGPEFSHMTNFSSGLSMLLHE